MPLQAPDPIREPFQLQFSVSPELFSTDDLTEFRDAMRRQLGVAGVQNINMSLRNGGMEVRVTAHTPTRAGRILEVIGNMFVPSTRGGVGAVLATA